MLDAEPRAGGRKVLGIRLRNDDATLARRTQAGDEQAFAAIFERHHAPLLAYCRHMLGNRDDGEDALQQAFIKAHRALLRGTAPRELRPWLYAIARNCCLSAIAARRPTAALEDRTPALAGLSDEVRRREDLRELLDGIGRLPEDQRSALLLAELDDLSHQAIATVVGCPVSKIKALIYQARSALIAERDARETPCQDIREQLAVARGGELRRGPLRRHLNLCVACRDFQLAVGAQRQSLAAVLPVAPSAGLMAAILGHGSAHAAGAAGIGGAGAASGPAGGAAGTSVGVTATGATASGGGGLAASGTAAASTAVGAGAGGGTSVGALVGGGLVTKLAVGGAVVALAAAGTVAVRQRPARATSARVARARLASSAAHRSGVLISGGTTDGAVRATLSIADVSNGPPVSSIPESSAPLIDANEPPGAASSVDPFTGPTSSAGTPALLTLADPSTPSTVSGPVPGQPTTKAGQSASAEGSPAKTRKARANLRRAALRRRALRLREARLRARLRKALREALRHRRHVAAAKPLKPAKPPVPTAAPTPAHVRHRTRPASAPASTPSEPATTSEGKGAKGQSHPQAAGTGAGSKSATGAAPETGSTGKEKAKAGSGAGTEKAGSTTGTGKTGSGTGTEKTGSSTGTGKSGSTTGTGKAGSGAAGGKSSSGAGSKETGSAGKEGKTGSGTGTGSGSTTGTGAPTETGSGAGHTSETSGAGATSGKDGKARPKKNLVEEEQLPNL